MPGTIPFRCRVPAAKPASSSQGGCRQPVCPVCLHIKGLGYGHNGAMAGYRSTMAYALPRLYPSLCCYGTGLRIMDRFEHGPKALSKAGIAASPALDYPGK
ncbi:hypothetical protein LL912_11485 [Niabella sp. CC-SYL272]|uniref:hypothetical protein n=1 Tax=Niabella agricola TaxID=2891571 RepID=UPI001F15B09B|nr:hypothetical protein [Niabella agricola]MCF3109399.1 hypothetical protein [Niabella agricola]